MNLKALSLLPLLSLFRVVYNGVSAKNDWSQPCLSGSCSFDITRSNTSMAATLSINGSSSSISDITTAAGWSILNCSTATNSQTIQLVCADESKGCDHLFQQGAENTIVRLPEDCGAGPFARVVKHSVGNQSLPSEIASNFRRSDGAMPQLQLLQIDANFTDAASSGRNIEFSLVASTNPDLILPPTSPTTFNTTQSGSPSVAFERNFELLNNSLPCSVSGTQTEDLTLTIGLDANIDIISEYNINIAGSIIPPKITTLTLTATVSGTFDLSFSADAQAIGTMSTGQISLFNVGVPGISIPNILTVAPQLILNGDASGTFESPSQVSVGIHYELDGLHFGVGPSTIPSNAGFTLLDTPVSFNVNPSVPGVSSIISHLIPTLSFTVDAFEEESDDIFLELESDLGISLGVFNNETTGEVCVDIVGPVAFIAGTSDNLFGTITGPLSEGILLNTLVFLDQCITEEVDSPLVHSSPGIATRSKDVRRSGDSKRFSATSTATGKATTKRQVSSAKRDPYLFTRALSCPPVISFTFDNISRATDVPASGVIGN